MPTQTLSELIDSKRGLESDFPASALASMLKNAGKTTVSATQVTVAAARFGGFIATRPMKIVSVKSKMQVCGSAGATAAMVRKTAKDGAVAAGVDVLSAAIAFDNAEADGLNKDGALTATAADLLLNVGDALDFIVTAAPTGGTGLFISVELEDRFDS